MSYEPKTWECGDTITAEDLNRMEEGIVDAQGGGEETEPLIVNAEYTEDENNNTIYLLDTESEEIYSAYESKRRVLVRIGGSANYSEVVFARKHYSCGINLYTFGIPWDDGSSTMVGSGTLPTWAFGSSSTDYAYHYVE